MRWLVLFMASTVACGNVDTVPNVSRESSSRALSVYTVSYPLQYFTERVGGAHVDVSFPVPDETDPSAWKPDADAIASYQQADLILLNGASFAKWVATATLPESKLVDTSASFRERYIIIEGGLVHSHGPEGEHSHGETAATTWLDPNLAIEQAAAIRDALVAARPDRESAFHEGFAGLEADLAELDARIERSITGGEDVLIVGSHPVYQYLGRRYGVDIPSVQFDPGEYPDENGWHELEHLLEDHRATWMLWEKEPLARTSERLRELGVESAVFDPSSTRPVSGDYLAVMQSNADTIAEIFSGTR